MQRRWDASKWFNIIFLLVLLLVATPAYANIGVPMLFALWPASWLLLLLIIPLEAAVPMGSLGISYRQRLILAASANTVSTVVGIPLTWGLLVFLQIITGAGSAWGLGTPLQKVLAVTVQSPWLIPYDGNLDWMIPAAAAVLCVPFFFMSVWCENLVARRIVEKRERPQVWRWAWQANGASYALILVSLGMRLLLVLRQRGDI
jgi:hypothetical protein